MSNKLLNKKGVTLVELLVALALSIIVMVPALTFLINSMQSAQLENNRIEVTRIARDTVREISDAIRKKDGDQVSIVLNYTTDSDALRLNSDYFYWHDQKLMFGDKSKLSSVYVYKEKIAGFRVEAIKGTNDAPEAIWIEVTVENDNNISKTVETTVYIRGR